MINKTKWFEHCYIMASIVSVVFFSSWSFCVNLKVFSCSFSKPKGLVISEDGRNAYGFWTDPQFVTSLLTCCLTRARTGAFTFKFSNFLLHCSYIIWMTQSKRKNGSYIWVSDSWLITRAVHDSLILDRTIRSYAMLVKVYPKCLKMELLKQVELKLSHIDLHNGGVDYSRHGTTLFNVHLLQLSCALDLLQTWTPKSEDILKRGLLSNTSNTKI